MWQTVLFRLVVSLFLSAIIGIEREFQSKPAGLRTHMLVSLGCTLFMLLGVYAPHIFGSAVVVDPSRIAAQIVTGVGFLGAGTIIRGFGSVHGLTTAASIWMVAAVGTSVGCGFYAAAALATVAAFGVLWIGDLGWLRKRQKNVAVFEIEVEGTGGALSRLTELVAAHAVHLRLFSRKKRGRLDVVEVRFEADPELKTKLLAELDRLEGVRVVEMS